MTKARGSLHVCLSTVRTFEEFVDLVLSSVFCRLYQFVVTLPGKSCCEQDLPGGFDWLSICRGLGIFLMDGIIFKKSWCASN